MMVGLSLFAQTDAAPAPNENFPNLPQIRAEAVRGQSEAQTRLGDYHLGQGDMTNAFYWYRKAAEQGNEQAQLSVAACYLRGRGVAPDAQEASKWQRMAAVRTSGQAPEKPVVVQTKPAEIKLSEAAAAGPVTARTPRARIQEIPAVEATLETPNGAPLVWQAPSAEQVIVRSQLPRISVFSPAPTQLEGVELKMRTPE